jgi:hypothetical protein
MHEDPRERRGDRTGPRWAWAGRPRPAGLARSRRRFAPLSLHPKDLNPKVREVPPFVRGEPFAPGVHPQARERREISGGGSTISKEAPTSGEEGRHRRKGDHDQRCYV